MHKWQSKLQEGRILRMIYNEPQCKSIQYTPHLTLHDAEFVDFASRISFCPEPITIPGKACRKKSKIIFATTYGSKSVETR